MLNVSASIQSLKEITPLPKSICFIPDKNRTWAKSKGLSVAIGHSEGHQNARRIAQACFDIGIRDVIFWGMSESNLHKRSREELSHIVGLVKKALKEHEKANGGFFLCGNWNKVVHDPELEAMAKDAQASARKYAQKRLTILLGYRGTTDLLQATAVIAQEYRVGPLSGSFENLIRSRMQISHLPERIDMFLRTGVEDGQRHNSDSLLPLHGEQAFVDDTPVLWPDFSLKDLERSLERFGKCVRGCGV